MNKMPVAFIGHGSPMNAIVHNLRLVDWSKPDAGFDWADPFDQKIHNLIVDRSFETIVQAGSTNLAGSASSSAGLYGKDTQLSIPTPDHFFPLLYVLGACDHLDTVHVFNDARAFGSISMTSYLFSAG